MSDYDRGFPRSVPAGAADMAVDAGLRAFMLGVYNKLALGLVLAAAVAGAVAYVPAITQVLFQIRGGQLVGYTPIGLIVAFAPLVILLVSNFTMRNPTARGSSLLYWGVVALIGASLGVLGLLYTGVSLFSTFLITASAFGVLSLFGYATKKNLSGFGSFLIMGVWGLVAASVLTWFIGGLYSNPAFFIIFNALGVFIFSGLIAWKTQELKMTYYELRGDQVSMAVATNFGALTLFISFVNLFRFILALTGGRR